MMQTTDIHSLAGHLSLQFQRIKRTTTGEYIYVIKDRETELGEMASDLVYQIHDGLMPSDTLYETVAEILEQIHDQEASELDELNLEPDVYTSDLMAWMQDGNLHLVDDVLRNEYVGKGNILEQAIQLAQVLQKEEIAAQVFEFLENNVTEDDELEDDEPQKGDYVMIDTGPLGSKTLVSVYGEGRGVGTFSNATEAEAAIRADMQTNNVHTGVWILSDHGNYHQTNVWG